MKKDRNSERSSSERDFGLPRSKILRGRKNFQQLFQRDTVIIRGCCAHLRFKIYTDADKRCLMGFVVKKKLGKAVRRNRVRRLLKEAYRLNQHQLADAVHSTRIGFHGAIMANTLDLDFSQAQQCVSELLGRVRQLILSTTEPDL